MITLLTLLIASASAANYYPVSKPGANTTYTKKQMCENQESFTCWDITGKDMRYYEPGTIDVNDPSKPLYEAESAVQVCTDEASCQTLLEGPFTDSYCEDNGQTDQHYPLIAEDYSRVYCTQLLGYEQMSVPALVINQPLKDAADAADAAAAAEDTSRRTKRETRLGGLETCATTLPADMDNLMMKQCIRRLSKEIVRDRLQESEL